MIPVGNQILFKPFPGDNISEGGIYVPDSAIKESNKGKVVMVGEGTEKTPMRLKEGQIGYRVESWGTEVEIRGEKLYLMEQSAIIALEE